MGRGIGVVLMLLTVLPAASACFWPTASLPPLCLSRHPPATGRPQRWRRPAGWSSGHRLRGARRSSRAVPPEEVGARPCRLPPSQRALASARGPASPSSAFRTEPRKEPRAALLPRAGSRTSWALRVAQRVFGRPTVAAAGRGIVYPARPSKRSGSACCRRDPGRPRSWRRPGGGGLATSCFAAEGSAVDEVASSEGPGLTGFLV